MTKADEELVADYLAGDEEAFAMLLKRNLQSVYSFALRLAGDEADDITQDTFLKAWKSLKSYDPESAKFKTWLMRIARNTTIDHLRKKKSFVFSDFENAQGESFLTNIRDANYLPDELAARAYDAHEVQESLEKLSPAQKETIVLRYMHQMTFEEMSDVLAEPLNTVKSRTRRALLELRKQLEVMHQKGT